VILIDNYVFNKDEVLMIYKDQNMNLEDGIRVVFKDETKGSYFFAGCELDEIRYIGSDKE
jgi:hypothetical protein